MQRDYRHVFQTPDDEIKTNLMHLTGIGFYECDKSFYEDSFYHTGYYFLYVSSGKGFIEICGHLYPVATGNLAILDLSHPYKFYPDAKDPWKLLWMLYDGPNAAWFYSRICERSSVFSVSNGEPLVSAMMELLLCCEKKSVGYEMQTAALIHTILSCAYGISRDFRSVYITSREYPNTVKLVAEYIEINYFRKLTLEELAKVAYISPYHLLREFKKHTGFTPLEYTNLYRLTLAKQFLIESDLTIEQIALNTGFCSHSYFSRCFRTDTGITPERFRLQYHKQNRLNKPVTPGRNTD